MKIMMIIIVKIRQQPNDDDDYCYGDDVIMIMGVMI
jgi:hypothetical protein